MAESNGLTFLDVDGDDGVESLGRFLTEGMRCNAVVGGRACVRACDGHAVMQRVCVVVGLGWGDVMAKNSDEIRGW